MEHLTMSKEEILKIAIEKLNQNGDFINIYNKIPKSNRDCFLQGATALQMLNIINETKEPPHDIYS